MSRIAPTNHRAKRVGDCSQCGKMFGISKLDVDHIIPAGSIKSWADYSGFIQRLLCGESNMRLVCKPCHLIISAAERFQLSPLAASTHLKAVKFSKLLHGSFPSPDGSESAS
jgi:hypothetical protein